ncbi:O-antigen ligase family protein [soil metagenome]
MNRNFVAAEVPEAVSPEVLGRAVRRASFWIVLTAFTAVALATQPIETTAAIVIFVAGSYFGANRPDLALAAIALSVPVQRTLLLGYGDTTVTVTKVILWSTIIGWLLAVAKGKSKVVINRLILGAIGVTIGMVLSAWNASGVGLWAGETYRWVALVPVCMLAVASYQARWSPVPVLMATAFGTMFCFAAAVWQVAAEIGPPSFESRGLMRSTGPFGHPNQLALYFELTTPLLIAVAVCVFRSRPSGLFGEAARRWTPLWLLGAGCGTLGLLLSQSRGGSVGMVVGITAALLMINRDVRSSMRKAVYITSLIVVAGSGALIQYLDSGALLSSNREVQVEPGNFAVEERLAHWAAGVEMARTNPILGVGAGNYDERFRESTINWRFRIGRGHAHNTYLHMLAQGGFVTYSAYLAFVMVIGSVLVAAVRNAKAPLTVGIVAGATGVSAALLAHGVFEYIHVLSLNLQMAIIWSLVAALGTWGENTVPGAIMAAEEL